MAFKIQWNVVVFLNKVYSKYAKEMQTFGYAANIYDYYYKNVIITSLTTVVHTNLQYTNNKNEIGFT